MMIMENMRLLVLSIKSSESFCSNIAHFIKMKFIFFLSLLFYAHCENISKFNNLNNLSSYSNLAQVTKAAILQIFEIYATTVNMITPDRSNENVNDFTEQLCQLFSNDPRAIFRHIIPSRVMPFTRHRRRLVVLPIATFKDFMTFHGIISPINFWLNGFYVIVLVNGEILEVEKIFELIWKHQIYNINIVFDAGDGGIMIKTFIPFHSEMCNDTTARLINVFRNGSFTNDSEDFFKAKMRNLHNCSIRVAISNNSEPAVITQTKPDGTYRLSGSNINIIQVISESLNFSINYTYLGLESYVFDSGSSVGALNSVTKGDADLSLSDWWLVTDRLKFLSASIPYQSDKFIFIVPPGLSLSAFDKLILPFDPLVWIFVLAVLLIGFLVISIVKCRAKNIQNFVFGANIQHPFLNMLIGLIGGMQIKLPKRNFARFLLMIFLMYSLIMRTLYQGSYYKILKSSKHHKLVESIDEMLAKDFKFYLHSGIADPLISADPKKFKDR